ncbi:MAG: hypothetical protein AAF737_05400, partial [Pseudomonadota bacterium]
SGSFGGGGNYSSPGWQRGQASAKSRANDPSSRFSPAGGSRGPMTIEGELVAKSVIGGDAAFSVGERVFHQKFGYGDISLVDGNKLTVDFDKAGRKRVLDSFVNAA